MPALGPPPQQGPTAGGRVHGYVLGPAYAYAYDGECGTANRCRLYGATDYAPEETSE